MILVYKQKFTFYFNFFFLNNFFFLFSFNNNKLQLSETQKYNIKYFAMIN